MPIFTMLLIIAIWETSVTVLEVNPLVLPSPHAIAISSMKNAGTLFSETAYTMAEAVSGFVVGAIVAYGFAILFAQYRWAAEAMLPFAIILKATPLIVLAPPIVMWAGNGFVSKAIMAGLVSFFPVLIGGLRGLRSIDPEAVDLMKSLGASNWQFLVAIRIPGSLGYLFASLKVASSLAVVGAIIGELVGSKRGVGNLINQSSYYLETALVFAAIGFVSISAVVFFGLIALAEKKIIFWQEPVT